MLEIQPPPGCETERAYILGVLLDDWLGLPYRLTQAARYDVCIRLTDQPGELRLPDCFFSQFREAPEAWLSDASLPVLTPAGQLPRWDSRALASDILLTDPQLPILYGVGEGTARGRRINGFSDPDRYDAILVDARAGLHESTAAAFLGLGAEVLLFGLDEPQTFQGFKALFGHLARFVATHDATPPDWLTRLTLVQGKAPLAAEERETFGDRCRQIAAETGLIGAEVMPNAVTGPAEPFGNVPWDETVSDDTLFAEADERFDATVYVLDDGNYRSFDPFRRRDLLSETRYAATYESLLTLIRASLTTEQSPEPASNLILTDDHKGR